jgi:hypothetical protein
LARENPYYGKTAENRPAPAPRTHEETKRVALEGHFYKGPKSGHPAHTTGVKHLSGLFFVPLFNVIRDMNPDAMHIVSRMLSGRVMPLLKGQGRPAPYRDLVVPKKGETRKEKKTREAHNKKMKKGRDEVTRDVMLCELGTKDLRTVDKRTTDLGGQATFVRNNLKINQRTGALNAHDWLKLLGPGLQYIFKDVGKIKIIGAILDLMDVLRKCVEAHADIPWNAEDEDHDTARLKRELILALARFELVMPLSEMTYMPHIASHLPDSIHRWSSVRNYWAFFSERSVCIMYK